MTESAEPVRVPRFLDAADAARRLIAERGAEGVHHVACAVVTETGGLHLGLNLETVMPRATLCAEPGALSAARVAEPDARAVFVVAVRMTGEILPPCGVCRELLLDFAPHALAAVGERDGAVLALPVRALMPAACRAEERAS